MTQGGAYPPFRPDARVLACPACGYGCGCCCSCACQTPCDAPDQDGDCDCEYPACHGGHGPLSCHDWGIRRAAYKAASSDLRAVPDA